MGSTQGMNGLIDREVLLTAWDFPSLTIAKGYEI